MENFIKNFEKIELSGQDIIDSVKTRVIDYRDIHNYSSLEELFGIYDGIVLLLARSYNIKHWVSLIWHKQKNLIEYYDPYGFSLNEDLHYSLLDKGNALRQLISSKQNLIFSNNTAKLQELIKDVNTCGAHSIVRILHSYMTNKEYADMVLKYTKKHKMKSDEFVILILYPLFLSK